MEREQTALLRVELPPIGAANAFIARGLIYTAAHLLPKENIRVLLVPSTQEQEAFYFERVPGKDMAISSARIPTLGFSSTASFTVGDEVLVRGFLNNNPEPYRIVSRITEVLSNGRVVIERIMGLPFQVGMSGSVVTVGTEELVGMLVEGVDGYKGDRVFLEPIPPLR